MFTPIIAFYGLWNLTHECNIKLNLPNNSRGILRMKKQQQKKKTLCYYGLVGKKTNRQQQKERYIVTISIKILFSIFRSFIKILLEQYRSQTIGSQLFKTKKKKKKKKNCSHLCII